MSDIGGGRFFKDVALNFIMIYTYVFFFRGRGCRSLVRILGTQKKVKWKCFRHIPDKTQEVKIRTSPFNYNHLFGKNT